jgi:protein phosphatase
MAHKFKLAVGNLTDVGLVRSRNEDYYGKYEGHFGSLFLVCDGMGGHARGDIASRIAVDTIKEYFQGLTDPISQSVEHLIAISIEQAHQNIMRHVQENPDHAGTGTTLVLLLIKGNQYWFAHVGDSRIYLKQGNTIHQITKDHSEVQGMVDAGILTPEQAKDHPRKNFIARALGAHNPTPDISGPHELKSGDTFMMCTDGLSGYFEPEEIREQLSFEPQLACQNLVQIAKDRGGADNITVQIISARPTGSSGETMPPVGYVGQKPRRAGRTGLLISIALLVVVVGAAAYLLFIRNWLKNRKPPIQDIPVISIDHLVEIESKLDATLEVTDNDKSKRDEYQNFIKILDPTGDIEIKFVSGSSAGWVSRIVPGRAIYLPYEYIDRTLGKNNDHIRFLVLASIAVSKAYPPADTLTVQKYFEILAGDDNIVAAGRLDLLIEEMIPISADVHPNLPISFKNIWTAYKPLLSSHGVDLILSGNPAPQPIRTQPVNNPVNPVNNTKKKKITQGVSTTGTSTNKDTGANTGTGSGNSSTTNTDNTSSTNSSNTNNTDNNNADSKPTTP